MLLITNNNVFLEINLIFEKIDKGQYMLPELMRVISLNS